MFDALLPLYQRERAANRPMVLAVVLKTDGSTYSKHGTPLLIAGDGTYAGLLSGGCFEADLREHARRVGESGAAHQISYDTRGPDDLLFGLGAGCEGAMDIFLMRVGAENDWQPLAHLQGALAAHRATAVGLVVESQRATLQRGAVLLPDAAGEFSDLLAAAAQAREPIWLESTPQLRVFALPLILPPRILLLGAGPDTVPVVEFAARLGWKTTIYDHRPALADPTRFSSAERVLLGRPEALAATVELETYAAAVVMSHHLVADGAYLGVLAASGMPYVGLLGPAPRRERLRAGLGREFAALGERLHSPVGLALGGRTSASIALAIVAEIHAWLHGRSGGPFAGRTG